MKDSEKAKVIVEIVRRYYTDGVNAFINATSENERTIAGYNAYEDACKDDLCGAFFHNPYNIDTSAKALERARKEKYAREEILKYAIDVFLSKIDKETT